MVLTSEGEKRGQTRAYRGCRSLLSIVFHKHVAGPSIKLAPTTVKKTAVIGQAGVYRRFGTNAQETQQVQDVQESHAFAPCLLICLMSEPLQRSMIGVVKRMLPWLLNGLTLLSLLLCVASAELWVRSYRLKEKISRNETFGRQSLRTMRGRIVFLSDHSSHHFLSDPPFDDVEPEDAEYLLQRAQWRWHGFGVYSMVYKQNYPLNSSAYVVVPFWALVSLGGLLPLIRVLAYHLRRKLKAGACGVCGYDLRATPDRCPECGTVVAR